MVLMLILKRFALKAVADSAHLAVESRNHPGATIHYEHTVTRRMPQQPTGEELAKRAGQASIYGVVIRGEAAKAGERGHSVRPTKSLVCSHGVCRS
jgi:hypothetical protein